VAREKLFDQIDKMARPGTEPTLFHGTTEDKARSIARVGFKNRWNYFETYEPHPDTAHGPYVISVSFDSVRDRVFPDPEGFVPIRGNTEAMYILDKINKIVSGPTSVPMLSRWYDAGINPDVSTYLWSIADMSMSWMAVKDPISQQLIESIRPIRESDSDSLYIKNFGQWKSSTHGH